ncbi:hypothetical protein Cgig2_000333 [Carnegiea gigantea]|uniref:Uncharacterized protein n=1 Tax=Carnegiea gigantea TaxID=171969 RepID=A0A9Q1GPD0_9CARY|nr:hypothetical protein Cgig2_000333 [Carnegiea gigantea]
MVMSGAMFSRTHMELHGLYIWKTSVEWANTLRQKLCGASLWKQRKRCNESVWFYGHTTWFTKHDKGRFPRLASWDNVDHGDRWVLDVHISLPLFGVLYRERAREELRAEQGKHITCTKELEARLNIYKAHGERQDARHQPTADISTVTPDGVRQPFDGGVAKGAHGG